MNTPSSLEASTCTQPGMPIDSAVAAPRFHHQWLPDRITVAADGFSAETVAALEAMGGRYHESARIGLGRALRDPDKQNRLLALAILGASGDSRMAWSLVAAVEGAAFGNLDEDEQEAVYRAIADLRGSERPDEYVIVGGHLDSWDGATGSNENVASVRHTRAQTQAPRVARRAEAAASARRRRRAAARFGWRR